MRVLFAGTPEVAVPSLNALLAAGQDVVAVLTRPDAPIGRKRVLTPSPVAARAAELGIPVIKSNMVDAEVAAELADLTLDVAAVVAFGALVPPAALEVPKHGWINLHFSLLPAWRGAAPVQYSVMYGDDITGASTFRLEKGLDTGPIFGTMTEAILAEDTSSELLERLSHSGSVLLTRTLDAIESGDAHPVAQTGEPTFAPKLTIADGLIDFSLPATAVDRRVRGVTTEPGAWAMLGGNRVKFGPVTVRTDLPALTPSQVYLAGKAAVVGTASCAVELGQVQPAGKKMMSARDWLRGTQSSSAQSSSAQSSPAQYGAAQSGAAVPQLLEGVSFGQS